MPERSRSFGAVAAAYERFRPGYPEELVDAVLAFAGRRVRTAFEIGAGTGKATRVFAARGIRVTASDPDPAMLAELRLHVPSSVEIVVGTLEDIALDRTVDLVFAAGALHWTRGEGRWDRVAALLRDGGVLASFGGPVERADPRVARAVREARAPFLADDDMLPPEGTAVADGPVRWPGNELLRDARFTDVRQLVMPRRLHLSADDFVGVLSTVSAYLVLPEEHRRRTLEAIRQVLPETVEMVADVVLHLARRP